MKILKIKNVSENESIFVNTILDKGLFIDPLFENVFFEIGINLEESDKFVDLIYRLLWENVYIKSNKVSLYMPESNLLKLYVNLSEAIGFIYTATPPKLQKLIPGSIKSLSSIVEVLEQFLIDDNSGHLITYHSYFKKHLHFQQFETKWTYNKDRMKILRQHNPQGIITDIEVCNKSINEILNYNSYKDSLDASKNMEAIITFHCYTDNDMRNVCNQIYLIENGLNINNVMKDDTGIYVTTYSDNFSPQNELKSIISNSYKFLFF